MFNKIIEKLYLRQKNNLAYSDIYTGAYNRNYFENVISKTHCAKEFFLVLIDINNLKVINDTEGHSTGDTMIKNTATQIKNYGTVIRFGGDEFILIIENEELKNKFVECYKNNKEFSFGIFYKTKKTSLDKAISKADLNMYKHKRKNKQNRI